MTTSEVRMKRSGTSAGGAEDRTVAVTIAIRAHDSRPRIGAVLETLAAPARGRTRHHDAVQSSGWPTSASSA